MDLPTNLDFETSQQIDKNRPTNPESQEWFPQENAASQLLSSIGVESQLARACLAPAASSPTDLQIDIKQTVSNRKATDNNDNNTDPRPEPIALDSETGQEYSLF